jgi:hypothetical protein
VRVVRVDPQRVVIHVHADRRRARRLAAVREKFTGVDDQ